MRNVINRIGVLALAAVMSACWPSPPAAQEFNRHGMLYQKAADAIVESGQPPSSGGMEIIDARITPPSVYYIYSSRRDSGAFVIEFYRYKGFPLKHGGFLYDQSDQPQDDSKLRERWPKISRLKEQWYSVSD